MTHTRALQAALRTTAAALVAAAVLGACGVPVDERATPVPPESVPFELLESTTTTAVPDGPAGGDTSICLTLDSTVLALGRTRDASSDLGSLLGIVAAGPTEGEARLGLRSALTGDEPVVAVRRSDGGASVELGADFAELPADQQLLAVAQMTCALTAQPGVRRVTFLLDERQIEVPIQGGSLVSRPVTRDDYARLIAN